MPRKQKSKPQPIPMDRPLTKADLLVALTEVLSLVFAQFHAWQQFGEDVKAFHDERGIDGLDTWRGARRKKAGG